MKNFGRLPFDIVDHILSFSSTFYKENYKNRRGKFYKQIEEFKKLPISNVYVPIKRRCIKERFTGCRIYFWERFLCGKYILYIGDLSSLLYDEEIENIDYDENYDIRINQIKIDPEHAYHTRFCRAYRHPHIGYGIAEEHRIDPSIVYQSYP